MRSWLGFGSRPGGRRVTDTWGCEQCGLAFAPRREHARFCSARCWAEWAAGHASAPAGRAGAAAEAQALEYSVTAMRGAMMRLSVCRAVDGAQALAVAGAAVRWVTIADARLIRHHLDAYDTVLGGHDPAERELIQGALAGLSFVRDLMSAGPSDPAFIEPWAGGPAGGLLAVWQWRSLPEPAMTSVSPRLRDQQMPRYRAYQAHVAHRSVGEVFGRAAAFLNTVAASTPPYAVTHVPARPETPGQAPGGGLSPLTARAGP
jgi:hypothetical protein